MMGSPENVTLRSRVGPNLLGPRMSSRRRSGDGVGVGTAADFHRADSGRETENLTTDRTRQDFSFSGFQDFTRHAAPEILPHEPGWGLGWECPEGRVYARTRTYMIGKYKQSLNDRSRPF